MQVDDTIVRIPLRARDGSVRAYAIVDAADAEFISQWRWQINSVTGYALRKKREGQRTHTIYLHRELLGLVPADGLFGDHIDRDRLNCRRSNLRVLRLGENQQNTSAQRGTSSVYRGVSWIAQSGKWRAAIRVKSKTYTLGLFENESDAANAARVARQQILPFSTD